MNNSSKEPLNLKCETCNLTPSSFNKISDMIICNICEHNADPTILAEKYNKHPFYISIVTNDEYVIYKENIDKFLNE